MDKILKYLDDSINYLNGKKLDYTNKEDRDKVNEILDNCEDIISKNPFIKSLLGNSFIDTLIKETRETVNKKYDDAHKEDTVNHVSDVTYKNNEPEVINLEIKNGKVIPVNNNDNNEPEIKLASSTIRNVIDRSVPPKKPSEFVSEEIKKQIHVLTGEYMCNIVAPYSDSNKEVLDSIEDGLFEFACWMYNHK